MLKVKIHVYDGGMKVNVYGKQEENVAILEISKHEKKYFLTVQKCFTSLCAQQVLHPKSTEVNRETHIDYSGF